MSDSRQLYDDDHNMDEVRRGMQSGLQRGIDNLFNRIRQLEIVDVNRKAKIEALDARLSALESKAGDEAYVNNLRADNRKMALSNAGMTMKIAELERQLMAYRDCANCAESPAPTKRQQVAEAFLHAAETWALASEKQGWAELAIRLSNSARDLCTKERNRAMLISMAAVLEEAAREEQDG